MEEDAEGRSTHAFSGSEQGAIHDGETIVVDEARARGDLTFTPEITQAGEA